MACFLFFSCFLTFPAVAEDQFKYYIGGGWGPTTIDGDVTNRSSVYYHNEDYGYKYFAGAMFNEFVGVELGYADFGEVELAGDNGSSFVSNGLTNTFSRSDSRLSVEPTSWYLGMLLALPMGKITNSNGMKWFNPFIKAGVHYYDVEFLIKTGSMSTQSGNYDGFNCFVGGGIDFNLLENFAIRTEFEYFPMDDGVAEDVSFYSGSLIYRF